MRVVLVGAPEDRARLRERLDGSMEVVGEFPTLSAARAAGGNGVDFEAILIPPDRPHHQTIAGDERDEQFREPLTTREIQVLGLLAEGCRTRQSPAGSASAIRPSSFTSRRCQENLGAANRTDAVRRPCGAV